MLLAEMRRGVVASVLFLGCAPSAPEKPPPAEAPAAPAAEAPMPPDLRERVARSCEIGRQLYVLDKAAAIGTDVLLANVPEAQRGGVAGYIPLREGDATGRPVASFLVSFFTRDDPPRIAYEVRIVPDAKPTFLPYTPPKETVPGFTALVRARQVAISSMPATNQPVNPIVLPAQGEGETGVFVYLLAGTTKPNVAVFGKHYRALVPLGGTSATYVMPINSLALELPTKGPNGEAVAALVVNHAATEYPAETHVFTSLLHRLPIYVRTSRGNFLVDGDKITFLGEKGP